MTVKPYTGTGFNYLLSFSVCDDWWPMTSVAMCVRACAGLTHENRKQTDKNIFLHNFFSFFSIFVVVLFRLFDVAVVFHLLTDIIYCSSGRRAIRFMRFEDESCASALPAHYAEMMDRKNMILLLFHSRTISDLLCFYFFIAFDNVVRWRDRMNAFCICLSSQPTWEHTVRYLFSDVLHTHYSESEPIEWIIVMKSFVVNRHI